MYKTGAVIWITGLPGSGKTTFMKSLEKELHLISIPVICLDGDKLREIFGLSENSYTKTERIKLGYIYSKMCKYLSEQNHIVLIATVALFHEIQDWNRSNLINYHEVFMNTPFSELVKRDQKRLFSNYDMNKVKNVVGLDIKHEEPKNPDYIVSPNYNSTVQNIKLIQKSLKEKINV